MKVKFNLKNVRYAKKTADGYATPVHIPGAVALDLDSKGEISKFYADGIVYHQSSNNGGYEGDIEMAVIPDDFRTDILNETRDSNEILIENANNDTEAFALGFQIDGDAGETMFWFYNCSATKPSVNAKTNEENKEPNTDKMSISCAPNSDGDIRAKTTGDTSAETLAAWFDEVYTAPTPSV